MRSADQWAPTSLATLDAVLAERERWGWEIDTSIFTPDAPEFTLMHQRLEHIKRLMQYAPLPHADCNEEDAVMVERDRWLALCRDRFGFAAGREMTDERETAFNILCGYALDVAHS